MQFKISWKVTGLFITIVIKVGNWWKIEMLKE